jgi:EpsI family protein
MLAQLCNWRFVLIVLLLTATLVASALGDRRRADALAAPLETIPPSIAGWTQTGSGQLSARVLSKLLPTSYLSRGYQKGSQQMGLFIAFYAQQRAGESMHSPKNCLPGSGWEIWKQDSALIPVKGNEFRVNKYSIQNSGQRMLIFYWYQSGRRIIASEYLGKILLVRDALMDGHTAGSIVRIDLPDVPSSNDEGVAVASALIPQVQRCFGL